MHDLWEAAKTSLKEQVSPGGYSLWLEPLQAELGPEGELTLMAPNPFALKWVQSHYLPLIHRTLETLGSALPVRLAAPNGAKLRSFSPPTVLQPGLPLLTSPQSGRGLNQTYTFERFVVGSSNRLAYQASRALARNDTILNGVLFLTSAPGLPPGAVHGAASGLFPAPPAPLHGHGARALPELRALHQLSILHRRVHSPGPRTHAGRRR